MSRPEDYDIEKTVWRSGRKNAYGDELVVAKATVNDKPCYLMAWEIPEDRTETICWNGSVSWFPRMHWEDVVPRNCIKILNTDDGHEYIIKKDKHYQVIDNQIYIRLDKENDTLRYYPSYLNIIYNPSAKTKAIKYVQWFNENQRQLDTHGKLLSTSKQARKRRRRRAKQTAKRINTIND